MAGVRPFANRVVRGVRVRFKRGVIATRDIFRLLTQPVPRGTKPYVLHGVLYGHASAGVRACHRLVHELNEHGYRAYSTWEANPDWNETQIHGYGLWKVFHDPIVIYPEVVSGNPLGAKHVVRWALNTPGHLGGDAEYPDTELVYAWSRRYLDTDRILTVDLSEPELFNTDNLPPKTIDCQYVGKGVTRGVEIAAPAGGVVEITGEWPATRKELAELLRRTRVLYTYDDCTMLALEALRCGCRVVLLPEGRDFTFDDAERDLPDTDYEAQLGRFIDETQGVWSS